MPTLSPTLTPAGVLALVRHDCFGTAGTGRVGIEVESLTFPVDDPRHRLTATELLAAAGASAPVLGGAVTLEPGGQIEFSGHPEDGVASAIATTASATALLRQRLAGAGVATAGLGLDPLRTARRILDHPRYAAMEAFFATGGAGGPGRRAAPFGRGAGTTMMCNTASMQVNVDLGPYAGLARRWRLAHAVGPVLVALFANSPYVPAASPDRPLRSARQLVWHAIDRTRTSAALGRPDPAEAWARAALDARVMFIRGDAERYTPVDDRFTFGLWMERGHRLGYPTADDLRYHLTTLFPPVRARGWLELRYLDALPDPWWPVAAAITVALLDDPTASAVAQRACRPVADRWIEAASTALGDPLLGPAAAACFEAGRSVLVRLGCDDRTIEAAAEYGDRYVARRRTPADDLLDAWATGADRLVPDALPAVVPA